MKGRILRSGIEELERILGYKPDFEGQVRVHGVQSRGAKYGIYFEVDGEEGRLAFGIKDVRTILEATRSFIDRYENKEGHFFFIINADYESSDLKGDLYKGKSIPSQKQR